MTDFRSLLKPGVLFYRDARGYGYTSVMRLNRKVVWRGPTHMERVSHLEEAKQRAREDAECAFNCDDGSAMAEELFALVQTVS
jgi:hypothetical protein